MKHIPRMMVVAVVVMVQIALAQSYTVKATGGVCKIKTANAPEWITLADSAAITYGDSLQCEEGSNVSIVFSKDNQVLLRNNSRVFFNGVDSNAIIYLEQGQLFLNREAPYAFKSFVVEARSCKCIPLGTAAAVKVTQSGEPSVAVVRGRMQLEGPNGEPAVVEAGFFGTLDNTSGTIKIDRLPPKAMTALTEWSGVAPEGEAAAATPGNQQNAPPAAVTAAPGAAPATDSTKKPTSGNAAQKTTQSAPAVAATSANAVASATVAQAIPEGSADSGKTTPKAGNETAAPEKGTPGGGIAWQIGVSNVTVNDQQWTRLALSPDIPIWKFGVCLDLEFFIDPSGNFSDKGWNFDKDNWQESVTRKIRYLRFGHENEPLFVKVGGLDNVTLSYGFIMDRFTNMLHYPDRKLLGVQFYLNNISPLGITLQTVTPDVMEFQDKGGVVAARAALMPLKILSLPLLSNLTIGATYAVDINQYAPARKWQNPPLDTAYWQSRGASAAFISEYVAISKASSDTIYRDSTRSYALLGADAGLPIIKLPFFGLDVYGQAGVVADSNLSSSDFTGWGLGLPGVAVTLGPLLARVEYRHIRGKFTPGYFNAYYLDERLTRYPNPRTKSMDLSAQTLDGVFGTLGMNLANILMLTGTYQYMAGQDNVLDQRFEVRGGIGDVILSKIPKAKKLEAFFEKTNINRTPQLDSLGLWAKKSNGDYKYDGFFDKTSYFYYGYQLGVEIAKGATLMWVSRFGFAYDKRYNLVPNNNVSIETVVSF